MTMNTSTVSVERASSRASRAALAALVGGLIAGSVDIAAAALISTLDPRIILRFVAGGVQGKAALQGGAASAWLGLGLQWGMSMLIAAIFVIAGLRLRWLITRWVAAGLAYGVVVFGVMNYVVMPLSAWHRINQFSPGSFVANLVAMLVFGLIIAFTTRRLAGQSNRG
jgi:hypothetical protein